MSNAIAQSATNLAVSSPQEVDVKALVVKNATRSVKGINRERLMLNQNKLMQAVRIEYKSLCGKEKTLRISDEEENMLQEAVNNFIMENVNRINPINCISFNRKDKHDFRNLRVVERLTAIGEDTLQLQAQLEGCNRLIRACQEKLDNAIKQDANGNSKRDYAEVIKNCQKEMGELQVTKNHIQATIEVTKTK